MKRIILVFVLLLLVGCKGSKVVNNNDKVDLSMKVIINEEEYKVSLENNDTVNKFLSKLPQEFNMNDLNSNEKYVYLDFNLPTNASNPGTINKGDIMLFGDNCLVIFYKTFNSSYSYTKIGHIDNLPDLGNNDITILFEK